MKKLIKKIKLILRSKENKSVYNSLSNDNHYEKMKQEVQKEIIKEIDKEKKVTSFLKSINIKKANNTSLTYQEKEQLQLIISNYN